MHWANQYIGIPWKLGGNDLNEGFDCWSFFRFIQKKHFNLILPKIEGLNYNFYNTVKQFRFNNERLNWKNVNEPKHGDATFLRIAKYPNHVGIWLDDGVHGVLHTIEKIGVIFQEKSNLVYSGWKIANFYRHKSKL